MLFAGTPIVFGYRSSLALSTEQYRLLFCIAFVDHFMYVLVLFF